MFKQIVVFLMVLTVPAAALEINFTDADLNDCINVLARQAGLDVVMSGDAGISKKVCLHLENSTPEEALEHVLAANGLTGERKGEVLVISTLSQDIAQTAYKSISRSAKLKHVSAERIAQLLSKVMPGVVAAPAERSTSLAIRGKESDLREAEKLICDLDQPIPQVLIESKVYEISQADSIRLGFDHNNGVFSFINGKEKEDIRSTLTALLGNGKASLIASPRVATLDNHEAVINIGNRIPYAVPASSNSTSTQWTVDYIDAGVKLKITPQLGTGDQITTFIQPEVSAISEWRTTAAGDFPVISTRNAQATLRVKAGETIVVGGLISEVDRVTVTRTPILGQFPILNLLFQNRTVEKEKTEVVFLITPYLI